MSSKPLRRSVVSSPQNINSRFKSGELDVYSLNEGSPGNMRSEGLVGEQRVVAAVVGRLVNKLPCNSGTRLGMMEVDAGVQTTVQSILQIARIRLPLVVHALTGALETLSKYSSSTSLAETPLQTLHSQLYLLHILHLALSTSWALQSLVSPPPTSDLPRCWPDPQSFDEGLARNLLNVMLSYTRMVSMEPSPVVGTSTPSSNRTAKASSGDAKQVYASSSSYTLESRYIQEHSYPASSQTPKARETQPLATACTTTATTIIQITKLTSQVLFYLSASNWPLVFSRLKTRIAYLTTTIEENIDPTELRLLEWANFDKNRLSQTIQEVSSVFLQVKRPAQVAIAWSLHQAIWNWINVHPIEYEKLVETNRKLDPAVDNLFDVLGSVSDVGSSANAKRARSFSALMTMLLVISPDTIKKVAAADNSAKGSGLAKKSALLDTCRKGLAGNKGFEGSVMSYVDLVKAAVALSPRLDGVGVKSLVADIQNDLKGALFSSYASEISDPDVLTEGIVALFRTNSIGTLTTIFPRIWSDSSDASKIAGVRACSIVVSEDGWLPFQTSASRLKEETAAPIRNLLKAQASNLAADRSRQSRGGPDLSSVQIELTCQILELYNLDPGFAFGSADRSDSGILNIISSLCLASSPAVRSAASRLVIVLLHSRAGGDMLSKDLQDSKWQAMVDASRQALLAFHSGDAENISMASDAFNQIVQSILRLSNSRPELAMASSARSAVLLASVAALTGLTGPDVEQTALTMPVLRSLGLLIKSLPPIPGNQEQETTETALANAFEELALLPHATGRQQQQRQIRRVIRPYCQSSTAWNTVWLGLAARINALTDKIAKHESESNGDSRRRGLAADIEGLSEDESKEWQNLLFFLCCTAGVSLSDVSSPADVIDATGRGLLPRLYEESANVQTAVDSFIRKCVDFLIDESIYIREAVKDALGNELPPSLGRVLVIQMSRVLSHSIGLSGVTCSDTFTTFVEQAISVLRLLVERMVPGDTHGSLHIEMGDIMLTLAQYIHRLGRDDVSLRVKIRFCQLIEAVLQKQTTVILSNSSRLKNGLIEWISEWSTDSRDTEGYHFYDASSKLQKELDQACLRATVHVTEGLVLRASGDESDDTQGVVKSRLFYRHYQHLVKVLGKSQFSETDSLQAPSLSGMNHSVKTGDEEAPLALTALSNLLAANIDVGLKHCLTLGYHDDSNLRTAFMQLLSSILQQGTRFHGLTAQRASSSPKLYLELLTSSNLAFVVGICEVVPSQETDEISSLLFRAFEARGSLLSLMRALIEYEVAQTNQETELFRSTTFTTRMMTLFAKTYGYNYVRATIQPFIHSLLEKPADCSFELDPSKASPSDDIEKNVERLKLTCQALLDLICSSTPRVPIMFRALCHHIWDVVVDRFPASKHSAVGSFIFLRFFCPALIQPEGIDLDANTDNKEVRRALLLITKVVQNLANNVVFGAKEQHMKVLNGFLSDNIRQVTKFLSDCAVRPRTNEIGPVVKAFQEEAERCGDAEGDDAAIQRFVFKHFNRLEASLEALPSSFSSKPPLSARAGRLEMDGKAVLDQLKRAMEQTGSPNDDLRLNASARSSVYDEFMRHNQGRNTDSVAGAFYEGPASQNGRRIFYFVVARVALVDYDLLAYHVFQILDKITDFFDLVIDLTDFSVGTELPSAWIRRSLQMCPPGIIPCIHTLALYNPNSYAKRRGRRLVAELAPAGVTIGKTVIAASSPAELAETIPFTSLALPANTMSLAYEADHVFTNLLCLADHEQQVPVIVKLGHDCIQVASWKKQDITSTVRAYIIDVIRLKDIDDIVSGSGLTADHLVVKHSQTEAITFISRKRNEMAQIIRAARARLRDAPSEERALRPSDVPGTLLNVALLNLSSDNELLRLGAFNLIVELCQFFRYELIDKPFKVTGLHIPGNSLSFIFDLSKNLATSAPQLTLEFLKEWTIGFNKGDIPQKIASLHYVGPWLANLELFSKPTREEGVDHLKHVTEIIRALISLTASEKTRLHLSLQENIWAVLGNAHEALVDFVVEELLLSAIDAGLGSEKAECAADILVSMSSITVRGKVIARLRKTIAQTYLKPSSTLVENVAWPEICTLARVNLMLAFSPQTAIDTQIFLPELFHNITLMLGSGSVLMRQSVYGLLVNILQSLASSPASGDIDQSGLQYLLRQLQQPDLIAVFGLSTSPGSLELIGRAQRDEIDVGLLSSVETVSKFLGDVVAAGAISMDCANAWRARWMGLVAGTCFQHNPATQPQAFTVLGYLAQDEVDDDLVYQILVAMSTSLSHFTENDSVLIVSMLRCLSRVIPGLLSDSRYSNTLFWLAIAVLQLGYIPLFGAALELMLTSLKAMHSSGALGDDIAVGLVAARHGIGEAAKKLDQVCGVSFETDVCFSLVAIIFKGIRHPSTKALTIESLSELLRLSSSSQSGAGDDSQLINTRGVAFFISLLPIVSSTPQDLKSLFADAGLDVSEETVNDIGGLSVFDLLSVPDNSTALLVVTLVITILNGATSDAEKLILYRFLAEACVEVPEVVAMAYDSLVPRMTAVLATTSNLQILSTVTFILEKAMSDPNYTFPILPSSGMNESTPSLHGHGKSYSASISSVPSMGMGAREQVLDDLGMKGLGELTFPQVKIERLTAMAKWVASVIGSLTV